MKSADKLGIVVAISVVVIFVGIGFGVSNTTESQKINEAIDRPNIQQQSRDVDLSNQLIKSQNAKIRLIATDGVFSMDGYIAKLNEITALAEKYDAMVLVDDSHATGFVGKTLRSITRQLAQ